ncbi:MAG TPA: DUF448 domain-containing protein [Polyangiaceae bacterium]|nr:DUF448 domain-containing protein [Polyangiaceae bacterium]
MPSLRTCVGCRASGPPPDLVRLIVGPDGEVVPDLGGGAFGRGAWVHPRPACVADAVRGGLSRGLKTKITTSVSEVNELLRQAASRRVVSLLQAAQRAQLAALGTTALEEAERDDSVQLLVLAGDAKASAQLSPVMRLAQRGRVRLFKTKAELGAAFGRDELALVGLLSPDLSREVSRMISVSELEEPGRAHRVTEVG